MIVRIPVSLGELIDKISILIIKEKNIKNLDKQKLIKEELDLLKKDLNEVMGEKFEVNLFLDRLIEVNSKLWEIEDNLRFKESQKNFDKEFIELARSVYRFNDSRSKIKLEINNKFGSKIIEVKSYEEY
tara:strand:+ start:1233 stop:1619 length:387 start_codon:yes stop_codon:yes gene_type:complete